INHVECDLVLHAGDSSLEKGSELLKLFKTVQGNHDYDYLPFIREFHMEGKKILLTHGHKFNVYAGYKNLVEYMKENDYDICFHGHTHIPHMEMVEGKLFVNPGSSFYNRGDFDGKGTYAIVEITQEEVTVTFYDSWHHKEIPYETIQKKTEYLLKEFRRFALFGY
ncbi:MAG: YfcE family phosphodiesterase, partial [Holdemanella sp.]|nr:YfcE family phosphodiesterase [Holdemanella sp.]